MADQNDTLDIPDEDAERLLDDPPEERPARRERGERTDERRSERRTRRGATDDDGDDSEDDADGEPLREQGRRALDAMKEQRRRARAETAAAKRELDELRQRLEQYESANKSDLQRLQEAAESGKSRADKAEAALRRREIAEERAPAHASLAQIKAVAKRLAGDDDDALADDADELFELLAPAPPEPPKARTTRRPEERLSRPRGGVDPEEDDDVPDDPRKLAAYISERNR